MTSIIRGILIHSPQREWALLEGVHTNPNSIYKRDVVL